MGCGGSVNKGDKGGSQSDLEEKKAEIAARRREVDSKDQQIQDETERLVRTFSQRGQEARDKDQLELELAALTAAQRRELQSQRDRLQAEHEKAVRQHSATMESEEFHEKTLTIVQPNRLEYEAGEERIRCEATNEGRGSPSDWFARDARGQVYRSVEVDALVRDDAPIDSYPVTVVYRWRQDGDPLGDIDDDFREKLNGEVERVQQESRGMVKEEEQRAAAAREKLTRMRAEVRQLQQERDSEEEAASVTREAFHAERRAAKRQDEMILAEVRTQASETDALGDSYRALEGKARSLQHELNKVSYTVGQRDHELKVKDSDLAEVRQSLTSVQDDMDIVNRQLQEQCSRVQRVEASLRSSRDLGAKVRALREMLKESHGAMGQLSTMLEQERARREHCTQGLKQQRVRTELLLQLLHHFKNRTQDLAAAPQSLLSNQSFGQEMPGSSRGTDPGFPALSMRG